MSSDRVAGGPRNHDLYAGIGFLLVGSAALLIGDGWGERSWVFPNTLSTCMLVVGAVLIVKAFVTRRRERMFASWRVVLEAAGFAGAMIAYFSILGLLGYVVATTLFLWGLSFALNRQASPPVLLFRLAVSVAAALALYALFGLFLNVPLPDGVWG